MKHYTVITVKKQTKPRKNRHKIRSGEVFQFDIGNAGVMVSNNKLPTFKNERDTIFIDFV